jgi:hypothetical protein
MVNDMVSGSIIKAKRAVISNASIWDTMRLLSPELFEKFSNKRDAGN